MNCIIATERTIGDVERDADFERVARYRFETYPDVGAERHVFKHKPTGQLVAADVYNDPTGPFHWHPDSPKTWSVVEPVTTTTTTYEAPPLRTKHVMVTPIEAKVDIGAANVPRDKELRLKIRRPGMGNVEYTILVADDQSSAIDLHEEGAQFALSFDTGIARELIGYALRRAICRGIDKVEVVETSTEVVIDLGEFKR